MPNYCSNSLTIEGKHSHRQEFVDKNRGFIHTDRKKEKEYKELSFHAQVPIPKKHTTKKGDGWYHWCINKWGTKWDASEPCVDHNEHSTSYGFETAWSPPSAWVQKVSRKFPHLKFKVTWAEEGGSGGRFMFQGGDCFYSSIMTQEEWKEDQGYGEDEE